MDYINGGSVVSFFNFCFWALKFIYSKVQAIVK